jgi:hypothetical protein
MESIYFSEKLLMTVNGLYGVIFRKKEFFVIYTCLKIIQFVSVNTQIHLTSSDLSWLPVVSFSGTGTTASLAFALHDGSKNIIMSGSIVQDVTSGGGVIWNIFTLL